MRTHYRSSTRAASQANRPRRRAKDQRQRALLDSAIVAFARHGFDAATTRVIAEGAGCAEGLIHRYFKGKRGLLTAIVESRAAQVAGDLQALPQGETVEEEIRQLLEFMLASIWERRDVMRVCQSEAITDSSVAKGILPIGRTYGEFMATRLRRLQDMGRARRDVDAEALGMAITFAGLSLGFTGQVVLGLDRNLVLRSAEELAEVLATGLKA